MKIIAIVECAMGNGQVGSMWLETRSFDDTATLAEVMAWKTRMGQQGDGKLILAPDRAPPEKP